MKVRMLVGITGTRDGVDWPPIGGVLDLPDGEAADYIAAGLCMKAEADAPEAATAPAPETATAPKPRARKATS